MAHRLLPILFFLALISSGSLVWAQQDQLQSTDPSPNEVCAGNRFQISGFQEKAFPFFVVQLSDANGTNFRTIPSETISNTGRNLATARVTVPTSVTPGKYKVRLMRADSTLISNLTDLTVSPKPNPPSGVSPQYDCQFRSTTANANTFLQYTTVYLTGLIPNSEVIFYDEKNNRINFTREDSSNPNSSSRSFKSPTYLNGTPGTRTFRITQLAYNCESDGFLLQIVIKPRPESGPQIQLKETAQVYPLRPTFPASQVIAGRVIFCQGSSTTPISAYHASPPDGFSVKYTVDSTGSSSANPYMPQTAATGRTLYRLSNTPVDPEKGCSNHPLHDSWIAVDVIPHPVKPTVSTTPVSLCQFQQANPLSATKTDNNSTLVWYGTNATGGTGSIEATKPSTANAGTFKYYVAQKVNDCESERVEITVEVKQAPKPPIVPEQIIECQKADGSNAVIVFISVTAVSPNTVKKLYAADGKLLTTSSAYPPDGFEVSKFTATYFVTQTVDGCESEKSKVDVIIKPKANVTATPLNVYGSGGQEGLYGRIAYCQGDKALSLKDFGIKPLPDNITVRYIKESGDLEFEGNPPVPKTDKPGQAVYSFITYLDGCASTLYPYGRLTVTVNPRPIKPAVSTATISLCQFQQASPLTATKTDTSATLIWYGTNATGGTGSAIAPQPSSANAGTFKYYVAQKVNDCESERAEIIVEIKPKPAAPGVKSIAACQNTPAPTLSANGENLLWYTAETGGSGSNTAPTLETGQTSQKIYYVTQTTNGCESGRAALSFTVNAIPGVPTVANVGPVYCQGAQANTLAADGQNLKWYRESSGGTSLGSTFTPETNTAGSFTYYVSQSINGCEGGRSSLTIKINPSPDKPGVANSFTYCQKAPTSQLIATGTNLTWYDASGKGSDVAPTPSTDAPGTVSYFVTQKAEGCESQRAEIKITTKATPGLPETKALSICQNASGQPLSANGQSLLWYTAETGGTGSGTAPTLNTGQPGLTTFYVSQSVDGCEGPRAALSVTVKALPTAPGVAQKDICQFAKPEPVSATGNGELTWYNPDGTKFDKTPIINTDKGATFTYQVSQIVAGCEGPKATLSVNVLTTPAPTVAKTTVELCQGANAQPLAATGINLIWTDPTGVSSTAAPVPLTATPTAKPEGDTYYVTQTGANGCVSPQVPIRVFVQTAPTLSISGTTSINLGIEVPLKLTFTGVGPYQYKLSNGLAGTATKDTTIIVLPTTTTTYQVTEVTNKCGTGKAGTGTSATVSVRVPVIQTLALANTTLCVGTNLSTGFSATGEFNPGSVFKLQVNSVKTDTTNFVDIPGATVVNGQISGVIPATIVAGQYRVRVVATNPKIPINGSVSPTLLTVRAIATATLTGNQTIFEGQPASLSVALTGDAP